MALTVLAAAHVFDFVSFLAMTARHGLAAELNPFVIALAEGYGLPGLTVGKIASVTLLGATFVVLAPRRRRVAMAVMMIGISAGLVGGFSNIASI